MYTQDTNHCTINSSTKVLVEDAVFAVSVKKKMKSRTPDLRICCSRSQKTVNIKKGVLYSEGSKESRSQR